MHRTRGRGVAIISTLLLLSFGKMWAIENNNIFVTVISTDDNDNSALGDVILNSTVWELEYIGYTVYPPASKDSAIFQRGELDPIFRYAREQDIFSLILIEYATKDDRAILTFKFYNEGNAEETASITIESKIDLSLDTFIAKGVRTLLKKSGIDPPVITKTVESETNSTVAKQTSNELSAGRTNLNEPEEANSHKSFVLSTGFAPFFSVGETSSYFTTGLEPNLLFGFHFNNPVNFLQIGVSLKMAQFTAHGVLLETENYLFSAGPDVRLIIEPSGAISAYIHTAGGPAVFFLKNEMIGKLWKFIPFISGGVGVAFSMSSNFGLTVNIDYSVYFENSVLIMGVSPSINAVLNL